MFGRRRNKPDEEAQREAERRALFEELAKRPDTVCPFLGMANARTEYRDGVSDEHRCYAFGDPAELSAEQQTRVCLERGYGNCPRYLRGVLVIPTEELEALRKPAPAPAPVTATRPPVAAPAARRGGRGRIVAMVLGLLLLVGAAGGAGYLYLRNQVESSAATGALPGGTDIGAELVSLSAPGGDGQRLNATAFIGETQAVPNTALVYVFDLSRSVLSGAGCGSDANGDGRPNTPLDCEIAAARTLNDQAVANGTVAEVGLVGFANGAVTADLAPADGQQSLVAPGSDEDDDGTPDVVQAMQSAFSARGEPVGFGAFSRIDSPNGPTSFSAGIRAACDALATSAQENRIVVFLSDGGNRGGEAVAELLPCANDAVFQTFAAGPDASCVEETDIGSLQDIAEATGGVCTAVSLLADLPQILEQVVAPQLLRVEVTVDGGDPIDLSDAAQPSLPQPGPSAITVEGTIPNLSSGDHTICMTVFASDAGGPGSVTSCSPAHAEGGRLTTAD